MELRWPEQHDDRDEFIAEAMDWEQAWLGDCCDEEGEYDMDEVILKLNHRFSGIEGPFRDILILIGSLSIFLQTSSGFQELAESRIDPLYLTLEATVQKV